jgi:hypothetical protein
MALVLQNSPLSPAEHAERISNVGCRKRWAPWSTITTSDAGCDGGHPHGAELVYLPRLVAPHADHCWPARQGLIIAVSTCFVNLAYNYKFDRKPTKATVLDAIPVDEAAYTVTACRRREAPSGVIVGNALIDMYAKCGEMDYAFAMFADTETRDVWTYSYVF